MRRKWTGILKKDLLSYGEALAGVPAKLKKGDKVTVWKKRKYERHLLDDSSYWGGEYEYHYAGVNGGFCRTSQFLLENQKDDETNS